MNPTHLAAFRAVAEAGGFVKAAERLMVSQPAISSHVAALERELGAKLLDRMPRGAAPTAAGEVLLDYARRLDAIEAEARQAIADLAGLRRGRLAIGASTTIGTYLLPEVLGRFRGQHPGVRLVTFVANTEAVRRRLLDGALDLALTEGEASSVGDALDVRPFLDDELVVIAPPDHALARQKRPTAKHLAGVGMIKREVGSGTRAVVDRALLAAGVETGEALTLGQTEAIKRAVAAGLGVAVVSGLAVKAEAAAGTLAVIRPAGLRLRRSLHLLTLAHRTPSPAAQAFLRQLRAKT